MKNLSKTIRIVVIAVVVLIVAVIVLFSIFGNAAIKGAVEKDKAHSNLNSTRVSSLSHYQ